MSLIAPDFDMYGGEDADSYGGLPSLPLSAAIRRRNKSGQFEAGDGSVLPRARNASASVPTNPVDQARILPAAAEASGQRASFGSLVQGYDKQLGDYRQQLQELNKDPDYTALGEQARARGQEGVQMMGAALAAGMGPQDMHGLQSQLAQQSAHLMAPQKVEGGEIDVSGRTRIDPGYKRQKQIETLREAMTALERQKLGAVTAEERYRVEEQQQRIMQEFRQQQLQMQREAAADRALNQRLALEARLDSKQLATDTARTNKLNTETQSFAKFVEQNALPNLITSANELDRTLQQYANKDIPGIGATAYVPNILTSAEGKKVRSSVQAVTNDLLKLYSGGAVTLSESQRRTIEMMAGGTFTDDDLRNGWPLVKERINAAMQNAKGGYSPEAVSTYEQRGGLRLQPIGSNHAPDKAAAPPPGAVPQARKTINGVSYAQINGQWFQE